MQHSQTCRNILLPSTLKKRKEKKQEKAKKHTTDYLTDTELLHNSQSEELSLQPFERDCIFCDIIRLK
jgi:hypothetical protein